MSRNLALLLALNAAVSACGDSRITGEPANPDPGGPPRPLLYSISPDRAWASSPDVRVTITGSGFVRPAGSVSTWLVWWGQDTTRLATTFISDSMLTALIPTRLLRGSSAQLLVQVGDTAGPSVASNWTYFSVLPRDPWFSVTPSRAAPGSADLTITVKQQSVPSGSEVGFINDPDFGSTVVLLVDGVAHWLATSFVSSSQLTAVIPASLLTKPIVGLVTVQTGFGPDGDSPGWTTGAADFAVDPSSPTATIIVYGQTTTLPDIAKGSREVALDDGPWSHLAEGDSVVYSPVTAGVHQLVLSNPCTGTHAPTLMAVAALAGGITRVTVEIPPDCE